MLIFTQTQPIYDFSSSDTLPYPEFVADIEESQGISIVSEEDSDDDAIGLLQHYGDKRWCERYDNGHGSCSDDGQLWGENERGTPLTCTTHTFPLEQSGYELVEVKPASNDNRQ